MILSTWNGANEINDSIIIFLIYDGTGEFTQKEIFLPEAENMAPDSAYQTQTFGKQMDSWHHWIQFFDHDAVGDMNIIVDDQNFFFCILDQHWRLVHKNDDA